MMSLWFRIPRRPASRETHPHRDLRPRGLRCCVTWRCRGLGARHTGDRGSVALSRLGGSRVLHARESAGNLSSAFAPGLPIADRLRPVVVSPHYLLLRHAHGTPASPCRYPSSLFGSAIVPDA